MARGKVLVLGNDTRSFLTVIRSLGRRGLDVHVAWCDPKCPACYSRYVSKVHDVPRYLSGDGRWKSALRELLAGEGFDLVVPCGDPAIIPLQNHRTELASYAPIYLLDDQVFRIAYNKRETTALARRLGIPVPKEVELRSLDALDEALDLTGLPSVFKPLSSFDSEDLVHHRDVEKAFDRKAAMRIAKRMLSQGPVLVQENFVGQGTGVEVIADNGEILSAFQHVRLHEPPHGGAGTYRKSIELQPDLYSATARFIEALGYTGVAMIEFKRNPATGVWVFLEINARFWGSLPLAVAAGIDFPWYLYQLLVSRTRVFNRNYRVELYCRDLTGDIDWFRSNLSADRSDPYLHTVPLRTMVAELGNIVAFKERSDTFTLDDLFPGFVDLASWGRLKWKGLRRRLGTKYSSLLPSRKVARRAAVNAICRRRSILYVCTGNICRSPFATFATRLALPQDVSVTSGGILFQDGRQCPANALAAARECGIDMTPHTAEQINAAALRDAGVVFVFDAFAYEHLQETYPFVVGKVHYLGIFLDAGSVIIDDPIGGEIDVFEATYNNIRAAIQNLKQALQMRCPADSARA